MKKITNKITTVTTIILVTILGGYLVVSAFLSGVSMIQKALISPNVELLHIMGGFVFIVFALCFAWFTFCICYVVNDSINN